MGIISKVLGAKSELRSEPKRATKTYLRIKIISLAGEARAIRREEKRWISRDGRRDHPIRMGLMEHRKRDIRPEARSAQLAYAFLRGRRYSQCEPQGSKKPNVDAVIRLATKYGPEGNANLVASAVKEWLKT